MSKYTACNDCKHCKINSLRESISPEENWYNFLCGAVKNDMEFDFYFGKYIPGGHKFCRDVNTDGNCMYFEKKKE